ncbi:MAG: hypothetical protein Ct9H300mP1_25050 [Planctomycetaceae bacterium]|nr:MAG: hypothetical protein Ct9H300mP1_25050 [Planctomycetaceae bacterium]
MPGRPGDRPGDRLDFVLQDGAGESRFDFSDGARTGARGQTAFEIVSIDIADVDVGENIGARLQADPAEADMRVAQAKAEEQRASAAARSRR